MIELTVIIILSNLVIVATLIYQGYNGPAALLGLTVGLLALSLL
ncbi:hypothetical protein [Skermanella rosea]|nr:hypothetical protein [Skermanella rosea]